MANLMKDVKFEMPKYEDIVEACEKIAPYIKATPIKTSTYLNKLANGSEVYFKCEMFQRCGVYKFRGVSNALRKMMESNPNVTTAITASSGNHGLSLACGCKKFGLNAIVVMPTTAPKIKVDMVKSYGAEVKYSGPSNAERTSELVNWMNKTPNSYMIHPYDNPNTMAGQGTIAVEMLNEIPDLDVIVAPLGGGGLISGITLAAKTIKPSIKVIAAEPEEAADGYKSKNANTFMGNESPPKTIADGLSTDMGILTWPFVRDSVDEIITVSEKEIANAMLLIMERMKVVVEPSGATSYACVLTEKFMKYKFKKVGVVLSGGNLDLVQFQKFYNLSGRE